MRGDPISVLDVVYGAERACISEQPVDDDATQLARDEVDEVEQASARRVAFDEREQRVARTLAAACSARVFQRAREWHHLPYLFDPEQ